MVGDSSSIDEVRNGGQAKRRKLTRADGQREHQDGDTAEEDQREARRKTETRNEFYRVAFDEADVEATKEFLENKNNVDRLACSRFSRSIRKAVRNSHFAMLEYVFQRQTRVLLPVVLTKFECCSNREREYLKDIVADAFTFLVISALPFSWRGKQDLLCKLLDNKVANNYLPLSKRIVGRRGGHNVARWPTPDLYRYIRNVLLDAVQLVALRGHVSLLEKLVALDKQFDITRSSRTDGPSLLMCAVESDCVQTIKLVLRTFDDNLSVNQLAFSLDRCSITPLCQAAWRGKVSIVKALLDDPRVDAGVASPIDRNSPHTRSVLQWALRFDEYDKPMGVSRLKVIELLLTHPRSRRKMNVFEKIHPRRLPADVDRGYEELPTILEWSVMAKQKDLLGLVLGSCSFVAAKFTSRKCFSSWIGGVECASQIGIGIFLPELDALLSHPKMANVKQEWMNRSCCYPALFDAIPKVDFLKLLLRHKADIHSKCQDTGETILHRACCQDFGAHERFLFLEYLLKHTDVDVDALDSRGCTALYELVQSLQVGHRSSGFSCKSWGIEVQDFFSLFLQKADPSKGKSVLPPFCDYVDEELEHECLDYETVELLALLLKSATAKYENTKKYYKRFVSALPLPEELEPRILDFMLPGMHVLIRNRPSQILDSSIARVLSQPDADEIQDQIEVARQCRNMLAAFEDTWRREDAPGTREERPSDLVEVGHVEFLENIPDDWPNISTDEASEYISEVE